MGEEERVGTPLLPLLPLLLLRLLLPGVGMRSRALVKLVMLLPLLLGWRRKKPACGWMKCGAVVGPMTWIWNLGWDLEDDTLEPRWWSSGSREVTEPRESVPGSEGDTRRGPAGALRSQGWLG